MDLIAWLKGWFTPQRKRRKRRRRSSSRSSNSGSGTGLDLLNPFPEPVHIEIRDSIDLHSIAPHDVKRVVEEYLRQAHDRGFGAVRIIHGKGKGVQRAIVRSVLVHTPFVDNWTDAPPYAGGWGATIAHLSPQDGARANADE